MKKEKCNKELMELVSHGVSPFHAVDYVTEQLKEEGYEELRIKDKWKLKKGGKYYTIHHGTTLIAFTIGKEFEAEQGFRIAASHTDFPCFRIKINPEMTEEKYEKLNVESYGLLHREVRLLFRFGNFIAVNIKSECNHLPRAIALAL